MQETFDYYEGYLCLKSTDTMYGRPARLTLYYPFFRARESDIAHLVGVKALCGHLGLYTPDRGAFDMRTFQLPDGGQTKPIHSVEEDIPCPKVRKGIRTRWESGYWQKLLKIGWVPA